MSTPVEPRPRQQVPEIILRGVGMDGVRPYSDTQLEPRWRLSYPVRMAKALRSLILIDDNEDDSVVMRVVIERAGVTNPVHVFTRAEDAITLLTSIADHRAPNDSALPMACFVDVNMTGFDGLELIEWVRNHDVFARMALVVLSASEDPRDLFATAKLGAQCFVGKFPTTAVLKEILNAAEEFSVTGSIAGFGFAANLFRGRKALPESGDAQFVQ